MRSRFGSLNNSEFCDGLHARGSILICDLLSLFSLPQYFQFNATFLKVKLLIFIVDAQTIWLSSTVSSLVVASFTKPLHSYQANHCLIFLVSNSQAFNLALVGNALYFSSSSVFLLLFYMPSLLINFFNDLARRISILLRFLNYFHQNALYSSYFLQHIYL